MVNLLHKRALFLSYFTVGYNILEGLLSIIAGALAGSIALIGFGLDSFVESLSGCIMIWRFGIHGKISQEKEELIEKKAVKLIGYTFFILGVYVLYESIETLYHHQVPDPTIFGILIALFSLIIMPVLFYLKYQTARSMKSRSLWADSKQTLACILLSISLLIGLGFNYLFGIWQADPIVGLFIVVFLFREGYYALKDEELCSC